MGLAHRILNETDRKVRDWEGAGAGAVTSGGGVAALFAGTIAAGGGKQAIIDEANEALAKMVKEQTSDVLGKVLRETSNHMKNAYARSDA